MNNQTNNNREQIIALLQNASSKVQIAVSWLTDEVIINKITEASKYKNIEILLSCDPLNVFKYSQIRELQKRGVKVLKTGANFPGEKGFMHAKFMILDGKLAYGGSFNFTSTANFNYENFNKYSDETLINFKQNYTNWFSNAKDYTVGFENPEALEKLVKEQFSNTEQFRQRLLSTCNEEFKEFTNQEISERECLIKNEIDIEEKRKVVTQIQTGSAAITKTGAVKTGTEGVVSKPHKFYGGSNLKTQFHGNKLPKSFSFAWLQKQNIEKKYSFLNCRVENDTLICRGIFHPEGCSKYDIKIEFRAGIFPQVYILSPQIIFNADIHIYNEGSLCLFYPGDLKWKDSTNIAEYTTPWIFEWIIFYELYLHTGKWEGESVSHAEIKANPRYGKASCSFKCPHLA